MTTNPTTTPNPRTRRAPRHRRGVAMVLVLVCMVVGTILAAAALSSNDNSALIGANAADSAAAHWAAESAVNYAVAVIEQSPDWADSADQILSGGYMAGGAVQVEVTAVDGSAPTNEHRELLVTATGTVAGIEVKVQRIVSIAPSKSIEDSLDPRLGEFGIFATQRLTLNAGAMVSKWSASPESMTDRPVHLGTGFVSAGDLVISDDAMISECAIALDANASGLLKDAALAISAKSAPVLVIPLAVPAVPEPLRSGFPSTPATAATVMYNTATPVTITDAGRYTQIRIGTTATVTLDEAVSPMYSIDTLQIINGGTLRIKGSVAIKANSLIMNNNGSIELADDSSRLVLYTLGNSTITDSVVGVPRTVLASTGRSCADLPATISPGRVLMVPVSAATGGAAAPTVTISAGSLAAMSLHAPTASVSLITGSTLVGHMTGGTVVIDSSSSLRYDPRLDTRAGFTSLSGPLYTSSGDPIDGLTDAIDGFEEDDGPTGLLTVLVGVVNGTLDVLDGDDGQEGKVGGEGEVVEAELVTSVKQTTTRVVSGTTSGLKKLLWSRFNW